MTEILLKVALNTINLTLTPAMHYRQCNTAYCFTLIFILSILQNIMVKLEFKKMQDKLFLERKMKIINEGVLPDTQTDPETFARMTAYRRDPIEAFKRHAFDCGVNLSDVFSADKDLKLTIVEFKDLIKVGSKSHLRFPST